MILTEKNLNEINFYHHNIIYYKGQYYDDVTLHFKSFWRFKKTIRFNRILVDGRWKINTECEYLLNQLNQYFLKDNLIYFTRDQFIEILNLMMNQTNKNSFDSYDDFIEFLKLYELEPQSIPDNVIIFPIKNK